MSLPGHLCATPPFAGRVVCAAPGCDTIISAYNNQGDGLCASCHRRATDGPEKADVDLDLLVGGLILTHAALNPGEPLNIGQQVAALGVEADCWQVASAVRHIARRHGLVAHGARSGRGGRPGYVFAAWERRYQPVILGGTVMGRDAESGRYSKPVARLSPLSAPRDEAVASQPPLPGLENRAAV